MPDAVQQPGTAQHGGAVTGLGDRPSGMSGRLRETAPPRLSRWRNPARHSALRWLKPSGHRVDNVGVSTPPCRAGSRNEDGFTLIELIVVMAIGGTLATLGVFGFSSFQTGSEHRGSTGELVSALRNASERSISEGRTHCVALAPGGRSYTTWRYACGATGSQLGGARKTQTPAVTIAATVSLPVPAPACPAGHSCLYFYPRGTATPATLTVASTKRSPTYTVHVEGLTARVYS